ncbi:hypothetical protein LCGC14_0527190 [marine sediment metagenome]|uniref:Fibronectin type-III domain-containing protein n=1 Tax=marine sediment metagenome TaxID=412755 RepID=A0A0F9RWY6_9ZZZZ
MAVGDIGAIIDSLQYDDDAVNITIAHVSGDVYALTYSQSNDGFLRTLSIDSAGNIGATIDTLEYDPVQGAVPKIIKISANVFAIFYYGPDSDGFIKTIGIQDDGTITGVIATLEFEVNAAFLRCDPLHIAGNVYAIAYQGGPTNPVFLTVTTVSISSDGVTLAILDTLEQAIGQNKAMDFIHIAGDTYLVAYQGLVIATNIFTVEIQTNGTIVGVIDSYVLDASTASGPIKAVPISDDVYAIAFQESGTNIGILKTIHISDAGTIGAVIDTDNTVFPKGPWGFMRLAGTSNIFIATYIDADRGYFRTLEISDDGTIGAVIDTLVASGVADFSSNARIINTSGNIYAMTVTAFVNRGRIFTAGPELAVLPSVSTDPATDIAGAAATLNGTLDDDGGEACDCAFQYGLTIGYGATTSTQSKTTGQSFASPITGLLPGTIYHFRAWASNSYGTGYGADRTFTTLGDIYPSIETTRVSSLVHRWVPGSYSLECVLGGLTSDIGLIVPTGRPTPTLPTLPSCPPGKVLAWSLEEGYHCVSEGLPHP